MNNYIPGLRCPECGDKVFWSTLSNEFVICHDMGHWIGKPGECKKVAPKKNIALSEIIHVLDKEIQWCNNNPGDVPKDYRDGFVKGLTQAKFLCQQIADITEAYP